MVDLSQQREWSGKPGALTIPPEYIRGLRHEIIVFARKERGGSDFSFRCKSFKWHGRKWEFKHVIVDTSKKNAEGEVELARLTYHPEVKLANIGFMVLPAVE